MVNFNSHSLPLPLLFLSLFLSPLSATFHMPHTTIDNPTPSYPDPLFPSYPDTPSPSSFSNSPSSSLPDSPIPSGTNTDIPSSSTPSGSGSPDDLMGKCKGMFSKVFAFGDSYTDKGNFNFMGGAPGGGGMGGIGSGLGGGMGSIGGQHGSDIPKGPTNGKNMVDFLCDSLGIPHVPPYKDSKGDFSHGANFAFGAPPPPSSFGDHVNGSLPQSNFFQGIAKSMQTQKDWFREYCQTMACKGKDDKACREEIGKALFWIGATGVNDYTRISGFSTFNLQRLSDNCILHISGLMKELLDMGAKNIVVHGLPPVGCLSGGISQCPLKNFDSLGCSLAINTAVMIHNRILQKMIARFHMQYPDAKILYADYWNAYLQILTHPQEYNFKETVKACCGSGGGNLNFNVNQMCGAPGTFVCKDPSKYMSWDGIHLTESMYHHICDMFLNKNFMKPSFLEAFKDFKLGKLAFLEALKNKHGFGHGIGGGIGHGFGHGIGHGIGG